MIRPRIVSYGPEWRDGLQALTAKVGIAHHGLADLDWNPLLTFIAVWKGQVVGFVAAWAGQPVAFIDYLFVDPDLHGQGIGAIMWRQLVTYLFTRCGAQRLRWLCCNPALQAMLEREGFTVVDNGVLMEGVNPWEKAAAAGR